MTSANENKPIRHSTEYVSLFDHFTSLLNEREKNTATQIESMNRALELSAHELERRLEEMNNIRRDFFPKSAHELFKTQVDSDIRSLRESRSMLEGKASQTELNKTTEIANRSQIIAVIGTIFGIIGIFLSLITFIQELGTP